MLKILFNTRLNLIIIALVTGFSILTLPKLLFDFQIDNFFPKNAQEVKYYYDFQSKFNSRFDEEAVIIGIKNNLGIFDQNFLRKTDSLTIALTNMPDVVRVYSLNNTSRIYFKESEAYFEPLIHIDQSSKYTEDSIKLFNSPEYRNLFIGKNGSVIALNIIINDYLPKSKQYELIAKIEKLVNRFDFNESHTISKLKIEASYLEEIKFNLIRQIIISVLLAALLLYILYNSFADTLIPFLIIGISNIWLFGIISVFNQPIDTLISLLPPLLATITLSNIVHFNAKFREFIQISASKKEAIIKTIQEIGFAAFLTSATSALGFLTLAISPIDPVRYFGLYAALGICISYIITFSGLVQYYNSSYYTFKLLSVKPTAFKPKFLNATFNYLLNFKQPILLIYLITIGIGLYYTSRIEVNGSLIDEIPKTHPIFADKAFMENEFAGTRSFEMALENSNAERTFNDLEILKKILQFENFLKDSCNIELIISPLAMYMAANKAFAGGNSIDFTLPDNQSELNKIISGIQQTQYGEDLNRYLTSDAKNLRISGRLINLTIKEFKKVETKIEKYYHANQLNNFFNYKLTGSSLLLDRVPMYLAKNIIPGLFIAFFILGVIVFILIRQWIIIPVAIIANLIPLIIVSGVMGLYGIYLKTDTAIIFSISLGMSVDNAIHFINSFHNEMKISTDIKLSLNRAFSRVVSPMVINTLVISIGLLGLMSSGIESIFYTGLLITLVLICGLISNLSLLPILISILVKEKGQNK
ncbi:MAG: MMPL family transporter [Saprospiraceae bacterium]|nr:MMPL family transporter [Candidatus Vicinibacter affinis]